MAYMTLNGIAIPVREGEGDQSDDSITFAQRSVTGTFVRHTIARRRRWALQAPIVGAAEASALVGLLTGDGTVWSFDADLYSDGRGTLLTASPNAARATSTPAPKFGAGRLEVSTSAITYWSEDLGSWSVCVWYDDGGTWVHRIETSDGTQWEDGVRGSYMWSLAPSGSNFQLGVGAWDDLVLLRFALTDAQGDSFPLTTAFSALPALTLSGDCVLGSAVSVIAELSSLSVEHVHAMGETRYIVGVELREV